MYFLSRVMVWREAARSLDAKLEEGSVRGRSETPPERATHFQHS